MRKIALFLSFFIFLAAAFWIRATKSFFNDTEKIAGNVLSVATSWVSGTPTPSPTLPPAPEFTPTPTSIPLANHLVINEVYYDADDTHLIERNENRSEWIEIYNPTSNPINVKNWQVLDNNSSETFPDLTIPAGGFLILAGATSSAELKPVWPSLPDDVLFVSASGQEIGNGLANNGDRVILKDNLGNVVGQMSYGNDSSVFNPPCPDVDEGHSLERSPAGKDTDTAGDFVDRYPPTPGS